MPAIRSTVETSQLPQLPQEVGPDPEKVPSAEATIKLVPFL